MAFEVMVDPEKCKGCEECIEICISDVFEMKGSKSVTVNVNECIGCGSCAEVCREKAITVREMEVEISETTREILKDWLSD